MDFNGFAQELSRRAQCNVQLWQDPSDGMIYVTMDNGTWREKYCIDPFFMTWLVCYGY